MSVSEKKIRFTDATLLQRVDEILEYSKKRKSGKYKTMNAVIMSALEIGLPILYKKVFSVGGTDEPVPEQFLNTEIKNLPFEQKTEYLLSEILRYLKKANASDFTVNKMLCGLYNAEIEKSNGNEVDSTDLEFGMLSSLPAFLKDHGE